MSISTYFALRSRSGLPATIPHRSPRRAMLALTLLVTATTLQAQSVGFIDVFAPENWTFYSNDESASVIWSGTTSFTFTGPNLGGEDGAFSVFLLTSLPASYSVSFDWAYSTADTDPGLDPAAYFGAGLSFLSDDDGDLTQSGTITDTLFIAGTPGFLIFSENNHDGAASLTISNFSFKLDDSENCGCGPGPTPDTIWATEPTGNWTDVAGWSTGVPDATLYASIEGASVTLDTAGAALALDLLDAATLTVEAGGTLTVDGFGLYADEGASLIVTGPTSSLSTDDALVFDTATALFADGATVLSDSGSIGDYVDSIATVTVTGGASWQVNTLDIGYEGTGTLTIEAGSDVIAEDTYLGIESGSHGTINISGPGARMQTGYLEVGIDGQGHLTISDGAEVESIEASIAYYGTVPGPGVASGEVLVTGAGSL